MRIIYSCPIWVVVLALLVLTFVASEIGYRLGRVRRNPEPEPSRAVTGLLKTSIVGLVALLLGFSFSITSTRYSQRERMVLDEANSIGTCYLRAGILPDPWKTQIRAALRRYTDLRLEHFEHARTPSEFERTTREMDAALGDLWSAVEQAAQAVPQLMPATQIVPSANQVIDLAGMRAWATFNQMPPVVVLLLGLCVLVSSLLTGHSSGQTGRRHFGISLAMNILLMMVLFVILDFDRSRQGFIQLNHAPLVSVQQQMKGS